MRNLTTLVPALLVLFGTSFAQEIRQSTPDLQPSPRAMLLKAAQFDTRSGAPVGPIAPVRSPSYYDTLLVQFEGPTTQEQRSALAARGDILGYVPNHAYVVRVPAGRRDPLAKAPGVVWVDEFRPAYKIDPTIGHRSFVDRTRRAESRRGQRRYAVSLFPGASGWVTADAIIRLGGDVLDVSEGGGEAAILVRGNRRLVDAMALLDSVAFIEEAGEATLRNDDTTWVVQSNIQSFYPYDPDSIPVWSRGLHGEEQIVGLIDWPMYMDHNCFRDPSDTPIGPEHRKVVAYRGPISGDSHGTHTAGILAGDQSVITDSTYRNGMAYKAKISFTSLWVINSSNLYSYLVAAHADGARCHSNSWGDDGTIDYTIWCRDIDRYSYDYEDGMVAFSCTNGYMLKTPENAKNVLAVGATYQAPNHDNHYSGGMGPTMDGRRKPEIFAPGYGIYSAKSGTVDQWQSMSGTSMACPAVTGMGTLVRQYYEEGWYPSGAKAMGTAFTPSGALIRATLLNGTVDMADEPGYPSDTEGWGRLLLGNALHFEGEQRDLWVDDVRNANGLDTGESETYQLVLGSASEPLRVTLVWTDPPAEPFSANPMINNLDLRVVSPMGSVYKGNDIDFIIGQSQTGGDYDTLNNVEQVIRDTPTAGVWTIEVLGTDVNQGLQGYALVVTGDITPLSVSTPPPGALAPLWDWISFPLIPLQPDPTDIFGTDAIVNRLFRFDPYGKQYQLYPNDFRAVEVGRGYAVNTTTEFAPILEGTPVSSPFEIALPLPGFSLIGQPYTTDTELAHMSVRNNTLGQTRTASEDHTAPDPWMNWNMVYFDSWLRSSKLSSLSGGDDSAMMPWHGYYVWSFVSNLTLIIPRE